MTVSSADVNADPRPSTPIYKRKRRRIYGTVAVAAAVAVALIIWAVVGSGSSGPGALPKFTISVSQGTVASPDSIIESQPSLAKLIPAQLSYVPFDAGVTAIAEMESGSVQAISGVGNPPTTEAIGDNAGVTVVMGWGFDDDQLLVPNSITSASHEVQPSAASPAGHGGASAGAAVTIESVGKIFRRGGRRTVALADVNLTVKAGELVCLLGPSGCGKSTLLRIAAGTLAPDEGSVSVGGKLVDGPSAARGMLFQTPMLFPWLTTKKNILFGPKAQRSAGLNERDDPELDADADSILNTVGLGKFGSAFPHELSGGMQHRAAFARAIITRPSVLLMDEPFGALDAITRMRMHDFLLQMWTRYRTTIIFVTHDIEEAVLLGDRVAVMGGRPPGIREIIDIPLSRPRHAVDADTAEFITAKRRIRAALTT